MTALISLQLGVVFLGNTALRLPMRIGVYGIGLVLLYLVRGRYTPHPAARWATGAIAVLIIGMLHPDGNPVLARVACVTLYAAVLSPLFWVGRLRLGPASFRTVLRVMWAFYTASAVMGVLQVRFPGQFEGATAATYDQQALDSHMFTTADGQRIPWPKGLSDVPGGASGGGVNAIVLGVGLLLTESNLFLLATIVLGMMAGLFCIFICQERTPLIVVGMCVTVVLAIVVRRGSWGRATLLVSVAVGVGAVGAAVAFAVGGAGTSDRFGTLVAQDPSKLFHDNRGQFLEELLTHDVFDMPLGAGEGRWGLVSGAFGDPAKGLWAEMMWQSLLYDGGVLLIVVYAGLLGSLVWAAFQLAGRTESTEMACWAGTVLGYTLAAVAATFVFPVFNNQMGLEVILLNACLFAASRPEPAPPSSQADPRATATRYVPSLARSA